MIYTGNVLMFVETSEESLPDAIIDDGKLDNSGI